MLSLSPEIVHKNLKGKIHHWVLSSLGCVGVLRLDRWLDGRGGVGASPLDIECMLV